MSEPGRLIREQPERSRVRLGKSEFAECDHLAKHLLGGGFWDAVGESARAKFLPEPGHQIVRAAPAHRAPQRFRLSRGESGERLTDLQHLILIKNHPQRFRQALAEQGMIDGWLVWLAGSVCAALLFAPAHVRIHRTADDGPRPHDRDFDGEVLEIAGPAAADHLDLRTTLDLEESDRVAGADAVVDRGIFEVDAGQIGRSPGPARDQLDAFLDE